MTGLDRAIRIAGTQAALARKLGVVPMTVSNWKKRGVPVEQCAGIEAATGITAEEILPNIFVRAHIKPKKRTVD